LDLQSRDVAASRAQSCAFGAQSPQFDITAQTRQLLPLLLLLVGAWTVAG